MEVFKESILEEHCLYNFGTHLWCWGIWTVGEVEQVKYKWKQKEDYLRKGAG